jgi:hypothetical protein
MEEEDGEEEEISEAAYVPFSAIKTGYETGDGHALGKTQGRVRPLDEEDEDDEISKAARVPFTSINLKGTGATAHSISRNAIKISQVLEAAARFHEKEPGLLLVQDVDDRTLRFLVTYMKICDGEEPSHIPSPLRSDDLAILINNKNILDFILSLETIDVYRLMLSAHFFLIKSLFYLMVVVLAARIVGQRDEDILERLRA